MNSGTEPTVFVVDDDEAVRDALQMLLAATGLRTRGFSSADDFLSRWSPEEPGCLVLDIRMPGMSGIELQRVLIEREVALPIIFITGHGDVPMAVEAMQRGAVDFILKPFDDSELLSRIEEALDRDTDERARRAAVDEARARLDRLTPREREVLDMIVLGKANKVVAADLGVSQRTVEIHRARVMHKMQARSLAGLVRMVMDCGAFPG